MGNFLLISLLETHKLMKKKILWIGILGTVLFSSSIGFLGIKNPENFGLSNVQGFLGSLGSWVIYYFSSRSLGEEFELNTSSMVFTSKVGRVKLYVAKLCGMLLMAFMMAVISVTVCTVFQVLYQEQINIAETVGKVVKSVGIYVLFTFMVGSYSLMLTTLSGSWIVTLLGVFITFRFLPGALALAATQVEGIQKINPWLPFYTADSFITYYSGGNSAVIGIVIGGILFFAASLFLINRKDLT